MSFDCTATTVLLKTCKNHDWLSPVLTLPVCTENNSAFPATHRSSSDVLQTSKILSFGKNVSCLFMATLMY